MKILFDENIPKLLIRDLSEFSVFTVQKMGWTSYSNGVLLQSMIRNNFRVLITGDKNVEFQQNFTKYPITLIAINIHPLKYENIKPLIPEIRAIINNNLQAGIIRVPKNRLFIT